MQIVKNTGSPEVKDVYEIKNLKPHLMTLGQSIIFAAVAASAFSKGREDWLARAADAVRRFTDLKK